MELFLLEHKKLWRKRIVKICVLLCFIYTVIFGSILSFQWFGFGSSDDYTSAFGNNFDGYGMIRESQEYALTFGEELTDETLQQLVRDYQQLEAAGMEKELEKTDWRIINSWLGTLYPELRETGTYQTMISYVNTDKLTGFYERRQQAVEDFLENSGQVGAEKEYLLHMEQDVEKPFRYEWVEGWSQLLGSMVADLGVVMALFLAIALSSLFAGEWHDNTSSLVLTTKNGWGKVASAKILTGLVFTVAMGDKDVENKVDFLILDCPVSDMKWMVEEEMRKMDIGLPISYMTFCGNIINKMELGFSYDDANVCDKIADIEIPVLVINSEADTLTPQFMGQEIYDSIQNEEIKMIWTVTDSEHTEIWLDYNQEYREKVQELLNFTK